MNRRLPGWSWLLFAALAAWPSWLWAARRLGDGSDDPLGIVALAALGLLLWRDRSSPARHRVCAGWRSPQCC